MTVPSPLSEIDCRLPIALPSTRAGVRPDGPPNWRRSARSMVIWPGQLPAMEAFGVIWKVREAAGRVPATGSNASGPAVLARTFSFSSRAPTLQGLSAGFGEHKPLLG